MRYKKLILLLCFSASLSGFHAQSKPKKWFLGVGFGLGTNLSTDSKVHYNNNETSLLTEGWINKQPIKQVFLEYRHDGVGFQFELSDQMLTGSEIINESITGLDLSSVYHLTSNYTQTFMQQYRIKYGLGCILTTPTLHYKQSSMTLPTTLSGYTIQAGIERSFKINEDLYWYLGSKVNIYRMDIEVAQSGISNVENYSLVFQLLIGLSTSF
jgi:hypothetical protein